MSLLPDLRTLMFAHGVFLLSAAIGFFTAAWCLRQFHSLLLWAISCLLMGGGTLLLALRGYVAPEVSILLGNYLVITACAVLVLAIARDFSSPIPRCRLLALLVIATGGVSAGYYFLPNTDLRLFFSAGVCGVMLIDAARLSWQKLHEPEMTGVLLGILLPLVLLVVGCLLIGALAMMRFLGGVPLVEDHVGGAIFQFGWLRLGAGLLIMLSLQGLYFSVILFVALRLNMRLRHEVQHDPLTGLYNRRMFEDVATHERARWLRGGDPFAVLFIDLDHFKWINDGHGHAAGDEVLRTIASLLRRQLREADVIARFGGEEFCVLMPGQSAQNAAEIAERLCHAVADLCIQRQGQSIRLSVSIGVALPQGSVETLESVLARADQALYAAKQGGRNRVVLQAA
ncbi:MAG: hypothetical protein CGU28_09515 [Candidatus Dactylopiibacterium carminicum]|nr:MAG: hypothetical protein CGU28_09515 [Candidatus Dactylopiibacterium carminicum]